MDFEFVEAFDQIDLVGILETMRKLDYFKLSEVQGVVSQIVRNKLRRILCPPRSEPPAKPSKQERIAADKQAAATARSKIVERKMDLGCKLAALRDSMPNNREFGATVRRQFGLDNALEVAEMMRVARLYGDRPEIFGKVGWRVLAQLSSTVTSNAQRGKFEDRIVAGEPITGAEIIRVRGRR